MAHDKHAEVGHNGAEPAEGGEESDGDDSSLDGSAGKSDSEEDDANLDILVSLWCWTTMYRTLSVCPMTSMNNARVASLCGGCWKLQPYIQNHVHLHHTYCHDIQFDKPAAVLN